MLDPEYYASDEDGNEPHGYWIKSANWERRTRELLEAKHNLDEAASAVREGRACWIEDIPF